MNKKINKITIETEPSNEHQKKSFFDPKLYKGFMICLYGIGLVIYIIILVILVVGFFSNLDVESMNLFKVIWMVGLFYLVLSFYGKLLHKEINYFTDAIKKFNEIKK